MRTPLPQTVLAVLCIFASCKKGGGSNTSNNNSALVNKVKTYIVSYHSPLGAGIDTSHLTYDNDGRLISVVSGDISNTYTYSSNTSPVWHFTSSGQVPFNETAFIKNGLIDSTIRVDAWNSTLMGKYDYSNNLVSNLTLYWESNGAKTMFITTAYTYDNGGNTIKTVQTDSPVSYHYITEYTYTDKPFQPILTPSYYPPLSKNLPATQVITNEGILMSSTRFSYVFDTAGRLMKETDSVNDGSVMVKTCVY